MTDYLTLESLTNTAAQYRRQQQAFKDVADITGMVRAEGAAIAIEYLIKVAFEPDPAPKIVVEDESVN